VIAMAVTACSVIIVDNGDSYSNSCLFNGCDYSRHYSVVVAVADVVIVQRW
ncbi:9402_t:CDS:1, partial [Racocetra persica]